MARRYLPRTLPLLAQRFPIGPGITSPLRELLEIKWCSASLSSCPCAGKEGSPARSSAAPELLRDDRG